VRQLAVLLAVLTWGALVVMLAAAAWPSSWTDGLLPW